MREKRDPCTAKYNLTCGVKRRGSDSAFLNMKERHISPEAPEIFFPKNRGSRNLECGTSDRTEKTKLDAIARRRHIIGRKSFCFCPAMGRALASVFTRAVRSRRMRVLIGGDSTCAEVGDKLALLLQGNRLLCASCAEATSVTFSSSARKTARAR